ncbi:restriction endonuclease subunit S [Bacillus paranthracis]|uniref:Restriction endonuclease subunit S n=1 Tax=Bacillus paranthracis TaxID=2026186 RepID=A0A5M9GYF8_9BACI|nr:MULTISPECIES: restriction endonuclease subunit S [Bacillus cereus group]KAA8479009.1 restriction endonuclease subunit S [Bacillus paranthracis]MCU5253992.1 restriction endonuclease subunit S [Bacillus cereus]MDZ4466019.1 restriction endonuclease subunit S [Bacillus cereus]MDZ4550609.1 restriction endonuclease subunit S [Bacillus cereus]QPA38098.1 restriction endonuclease subunit S [Bacillus paranthracis]
MTIIKIGDITQITSGYAFQSKCFNEEGKGIPLIRIRDVGKNESKTYYKGDYSEEYIVKKGDFLISMDGEFKIAQWKGKIGLLNQRVCKIEANEHFIDSKYMYYLLPRELQKIEDATSFVTVKHLSIKQIKDIEVSLPPMEEQKKIVAILDKIQALIEKRKEAIAKLDELIQAVFLDMFGDLSINPKGWCIREFSYFAKIDTNMIKDFTEYGNYPHIGIDNIEKNTGRLIHYKRVEEDRLTSGKYIFTEEHIIYSKIRPYLNKVALPNIKGLCSADAYPILINKENTNRYFFAYILRSKYFLDYVEKLSNRTNIPKVNKKQLEGFCCIAPPIQLQDEFANIVLNIEANKVKLDKSLYKMEDNFNSLLQKAFKGELKVNTETTA